MKLRQTIFRSWVVLFLCLSALALLSFNPVVVRGVALVDEWNELPPLPQAAGDGAAFILGDTLYYAGGWAGNYREPLDGVYNLGITSTTTSWGQLQSLDLARFGANVVTYNNRAYLIGGFDGNDYLDRVDYFDGTSWFTQTNSSLLQKLDFAAVTIINDRLYVAGGLPGYKKEIWSASINSDGTLGGTSEVWEDSGTLPLGLVTRMAASENCLYVVGGRDGALNLHNEIWYAQFDGNKIIEWEKESGASLPVGLVWHNVAIDQGKLYVIGGETTGGSLSDNVYVFSIDSATCALQHLSDEDFKLPGGDAPRALRRHAAVARYGELYVLGGQSGTSSADYTGAVWQFSLPGPELTLSKSGTGFQERGYGELITYTLNYANLWTHPDGQHEVLITDTLPAWTSLVSTSGDYTDGLLSWNLGTLAPGASDAVSFTVQVDEPQLDWEMDGDLANSVIPRPGTGSMTILLEEAIIYKLQYTATADVAYEGVLITTTLPGELFPTSASHSDTIEYAVSGQDVIWRVLGPLTGTNQLTVTACVSQAFYANDLLTYTSTLQDVLLDTETLVDGESLSSESEEQIMPNCYLMTPYLPHPAPGTLSPLYPDVVVRNQAWISSAEITRSIGSNIVTTRSYYPFSVYIPIVLRDSSRTP